VNIIFDSLFNKYHVNSSPLMKHYYFYFLLFLSITAFAKKIENPDIIKLNSITPSNSQFNDLKPLKDIIGDAQVVLLGEPTHGEGNIMEMNIEIIKHLHEEMGFNTIAFESGIYDVFKAQKIIDKGGHVEDAIRNSIFSIWTNTCEFQDLIKYIHQKRGELRIIGFDCQLTGDYSTYESLDDLQELFKNYDLDSKIDFEFLQHVFISFGEDYTYPIKTYDYNIFESELQKIEDHLLGLQKNKIDDIDIWLQFIKSTKKLAEDYFENNRSTMTEKEWKAWMSNPRDAQMADNLLFFLKKYPDEKVVCWGASAHFANDFRTTKEEELMQFKPMGSYLKQQLGSNLCSIASITSSGTYGAFKVEDTIKDISNQSLEFQLSKDSSYHQFINLKDSIFDSSYLSNAIDYTPFIAEWNEIFDAFMYVKSVKPSTFITDDCAFQSGNDLKVENTVEDNNSGSIHSLHEFTEVINGRLIDERNQAIPFCNLIIKNTTVGTITNETGHFQLNYPKNLETDTLIISSIGYESRELALNKLTDTIKLQSKDFVLDEVTINARSLDPKSILKKAIENIPNNYIQEDYNAEFYSRGLLTNYDTLLVDVENVVKLYDEKGYDSKDNITNRRLAYKQHLFKAKSSYPLSAAASPYYIEKMNMLSVSPLFKKKNIKKYNLKLLGTSEYENEKVYKIAFDSRFCSYKFSGTFYIKKFSGIIYINSNDYSIIKVDSRWDYDLDKLNRNDKFNTEEEYITLNVSYKKHTSGKYFLNVSKYLRSQKGYDIASNKHQELKGWQTVYVSSIILNDIEKIKKKSFIHPNSRKLVKSQDFWNRYNKPVIN